MIPNSPAKPIRIWMEVGDRDLLNPNVMRDNMHDWVLANENMAKVLADKGYHYQFVFAKNAGHCDGARETTNDARSAGVRVAGLSDRFEVISRPEPRYSACRALGGTSATTPFMVDCRGTRARVNWRFGGARFR